MYDPVSGGLLSDSFFHKCFFTSKKLHGEFVVCWLEERLELVLDETLFAGVGGAERRRPRFLFRCSIEADVVDAEMHFTAALVIHVVGQEVGYEQRLVVERGDERVSAGVGVLDADLDGVILGQPVRRR